MGKERIGTDEDISLAGINEVQKKINSHSSTAWSHISIMEKFKIASVEKQIYLFKTSGFKKGLRKISEIFVI